MPRVIISDVDETLVHGNSIKSALIEEYGSDISDQVEIRIEGFGNSVAYAQLIGALAVVRPTTGIGSFVSMASACYPSILCLVPYALSSNDGYAELDIFSSIPVIVPNGSVEGVTGYGTGLEFVDQTAGGLSAGAGRVCGKLLKIRDALSCTWWEARYRAQQTGSNGGAWDKYTGYGEIDAAAAIAYADQIPADPYLPSPLPDIVARLGAVRVATPDLLVEAVE